MSIYRIKPTAPFQIGSSVDTDYINIESAGNITIGSSSPNGNLELNGIGIDINSGDTGFVASVPENSSISLKYNDIVKLLIDSNGTTINDNLNFGLEDANTNTVLYPIKLNRTSTNTPQIGIGVGVKFEAETSTNNDEIIATIESQVTNITSNNEAGDLIIKTLSNGSNLNETFARL